MNHIERRHATRPHYRRSAERDHIQLLAWTFIVGAMAGASIALGWAAL